MRYVFNRQNRRALLSLAFAALIPASALADSGVFLPSAPRGPGGQDTIESATGTRCSQSINSSGPYLDLGVSSNNSDDSLFSSDQGSGNIAVLGYARIIIPLGETPRRIDCHRLYELELQRLRAEIELLRLGLE